MDAGIGRGWVGGGEVVLGVLDCGRQLFVEVKEAVARSLGGLFVAEIDVGFGDCGQVLGARFGRQVGGPGICPLHGPDAPADDEADDEADDHS